MQTSVIREGHHVGYGVCQVIYVCYIN